MKLEKRDTSIGRGASPMVDFTLALIHRRARKRKALYEIHDRSKECDTDTDSTTLVLGLLVAALCTMDVSWLELLLCIRLLI